MAMTISDGTKTVRITRAALKRAAIFFRPRTHPKPKSIKTGIMQHRWCCYTNNGNTIKKIMT